MSRAAPGRADDEDGAPAGQDAPTDAAAIVDAQLQAITRTVVRRAVLSLAIDGQGERFKATLRDVLTRELEDLRPALLAGAQEERRRSALKRKRAPTASEIEFITRHLAPPPSKGLRAVRRALGQAPEPTDRFAQVRTSLMTRLNHLNARLLHMVPDDPQREVVQREIDNLRPVFDVAARPTARLIELSARVHEHLRTAARERGEDAPPEWWDDAPQEDTDDPRFL